MKTQLKPILKWAGGKRQLLPEIRKRIPKSFGTYYEPFVGGGAVLFDLQPDVFVLGDVNGELINMYRAVKSDSRSLISELTKHYLRHSKEYYYSVRMLDRSNVFKEMSSVQKAARTIYLNKTCFNGLYRVNSKGQFNSPLGSYRSPNIINEEGLLSLSGFFNSSDCSFFAGDYKETLSTAKSGDFAYLDPPYDPVSKSSFVSYTKSGFGKQQQIELKQTCDELTAKGVKFLLSNSATDFIKDLYAGYRIETVKAGRAINSNGTKRGKVEEVLVRNY